MSRVKVDNIESRSGTNVAIDHPFNLKSYSTTDMNALTGMAAGDTIYNSTDGTIYVYNGTQWAAMSSSTFTASISFLVIAGGGSGAGAQPDHGAGGGGGAGGYRSSYGSDSSGGGGSAENDISVSMNTNYTVTVGAGGPTKTGVGDGNAGNDSVFHTVTSIGGGKGAYWNSGLASTTYDGGSGGGGSGSEDSNSANAGTANTGGGGGGVHHNSSASSGAGGSGIVILRFPSSNTITVGAGLQSSSVNVGSDTVVIFEGGTGSVSWS